MRLSAIGSVDLLGLKIRTSYREWEGLRAIAPPPLLVDIGVAFGTPVLYEMFPEASLLLIEPAPVFHDHIEQKILSKRDGSLIKAAAGVDSGEREMLFASKDPLRTTFLKRRGALGEQQTERAMVRIEPLDRLLADVDIPKGALLKIDTEGFELEVIAGAEKSLKRFDYVITEASVSSRFDETENAYQLPQLLDAMAGRGFSLKSVLDAPVNKRGLIPVLDLLFERSA